MPFNSTIETDCTKNFILIEKERKFYMSENQALSQFERFFELDLKLKNVLYTLAPPTFTTDMDILIKYSDKLYATVNLIKNILLEMSNLMHLSPECQLVIQEKMEKYKQIIANTDYTFNSLANIYNECFAKMSEVVLNNIKSNIFGHALIYDNALEDRDITMEELLQACNSANEMLHALHSYITNDIDFMRQIPALAQKFNIDEGDPVTLRGDVNPLALAIYNAIHEDFDAGELDIIAINKRHKILMMARNRGHALSIEIELKNDLEVGVSYFIPKASINPMMISQLKGINGYQAGDQFASGAFLTTQNELVDDIFKLIEGTPTDYDIIWPEPDTVDQDVKHIR